MTQLAKFLLVLIVTVVSAFPQPVHQNTLTWTAVPGTVTISGYHIYKGVSVGAVSTLLATVSPSITTFIDTNVVAGGSSFYTVMAFDQTGDIGLSNQVTCTTPTTVPGLGVPCLALPTTSIPLQIRMNVGNTGSPASLQFAVTVSSDVTSATATAGVAATQAGKSITCGTFVVGLPWTCLVFGLNTNLIGEGVVADINLVVSKTSTGGELLTVNNISGATAAGTSLVLASSVATMKATLFTLSGQQQ